MSMAGIVPSAEKATTFRPIHAHPANKESSLKIFARKAFQECGHLSHANPFAGLRRF